MDNVEINLKLDHRKIFTTKGRDIAQTKEKFDRKLKEKGVCK